jgi:TolB protein
MRALTRITRCLCLLLVLLGLGGTWPAAAPARVYIDVTQPFSRKLPLALPEFQPLPGATTDAVGAEGTALLTRDLAFTGIFDILDPASYLGPPNPGKIAYPKWAKIGAELLIACSYQAAGDALTLECRLYDVVEGKLLTGRRYDGVRADLPVMIHRFADEVMLAITGERSVFSTVIAFVGARPGEKGAIKEIYTMNFDGSNVRRFTHRGDIALYPAFSPDGKLLAYSAYSRRRPAVFVQALAGGQGRLVINKPGVNLTPVFRPRSNTLAVSLSHTGRTNIFLVDLAGNILKRLTNGWGIDVAPAFSPDGSKMAYVSDRGGSPQIYVLDLASGQQRRLTFGFKYCAAPDWSPRGDLIAFQAQIDGVFQVATIRPDGSDLKLLTRGWGGGEDPSFSPDGRLIAYASRGTGRYQIYVMTASGQPIRRITSLPGDQTDPAWSPRGVSVARK